MKIKEEEWKRSRTESVQEQEDLEENVPLFPLIYDPQKVEIISTLGGSGLVGGGRQRQVGGWVGG